MGFINLNKKKQWVDRWQIKDPKHKVYNAGVLEYGDSVKAKKHGKTIGREFDAVDSLPYRVMNIREQDKEVAFGRDMVIDIKIATPYTDKINSENVISLRGQFYNIVTVDKDMSQNEVFMTLQIFEGEGNFV